ncbi:Ribokinase [Trichinella pseudospiralis]|uniref:Ribokinase n=2 Tax=Trichinella pseudospiralis TaxID=6337 RepID=A0A0V1EH24_TRIPS|nr:Ribokinase [Trichinella pseudospiralis]KRY73030.1 Ribokinase [Trichinella pseudospiralis]KRY88988.1 Ribokinase [Trichinella pseudospiralis]KRZ24778.1 Ribokinase [Trichinella pseudospiralis]KRZ38047.1 Ribokinase [Trichinella pseudospiralis]
MFRRQYDIVVIGSIVQDMSSYVSRMPSPGETIFASKFVISPGGKGANQAVAAARLGASTAMVGKVGDDQFGKNSIEKLIESGVNANWVRTTQLDSTGVANVVVSETGENTIIVNRGANLRITVEDVRELSELIKNAKCLICQLEIQPEVSLEAMKMANMSGTEVIFNAAPSTPKISEEFYHLSDVFCVNETEAEALTGLKLTSDDKINEAVKYFLDAGVKKYAVITLGSEGCVFGSCDDRQIIHRIPSPKVQAVDTTGAGDCFIGSLAYYNVYFEKLPFQERLCRASQVASFSVQRERAQESYLTRDKLPSDLFI